MNTLPPHAQEGNTPKYKVYRLINKDRIPFYVGITLNLLERYKQHMRCDGTNVQKDAVIQEDLKSGFLTIMDTIEQVDTLEEALERETCWIRHYHDLGVFLTNLSLASSSHQETVNPGGRRFTSEQIDEILDAYILYGVLPENVSDRQRYGYRHHARLELRRMYLEQAGLLKRSRKKK